MQLTCLVLKNGKKEKSNMNMAVEEKEPLAIDVDARMIY